MKGILAAGTRRRVGAMLCGDGEGSRARYQGSRLEPRNRDGTKSDCSPLYKELVNVSKD